MFNKSDLKMIRYALILYLKEYENRLKDRKGELEQLKHSNPITYEDEELIRYYEKVIPENEKLIETIGVLYDKVTKFL